MEKDYKLIKVTAQNHWEDYHSIRRKVLWENRGEAAYDNKHEDEYLPNHHPLLLLLDDVAIGTARLDDFGNGCGAVRLVAIADGFQRSGHGRKLSSLVENYARDLGIKTLYVNAEPEALEFYSKLGWKFYDWDAEELAGIAKGCVQMRKVLTYTKIGGARIGGRLIFSIRNASWPFAKLSAERNQLVVKVVILGTYAFAPGQVTSIERYCLIPFLGWGVRIRHNVAKYPDRIIFWCLCNPEHVLKGIADSGFEPVGES